MGRLGASLLVVVGCGVLACGRGPEGRAGASPGATAALALASTARGASAVPVGDGHDWIRPAGDYASTRYSPLGEITADRVRDLAVKATFATVNARGHEAAPLVVGGTMYIVTPYPNDLFAL